MLERMLLRSIWLFAAACFMLLEWLLAWVFVEKVGIWTELGVWRLWVVMTTWGIASNAMEAHWRTRDRG